MKQDSPVLASVSTEGGATPWDPREMYLLNSDLFSLIHIVKHLNKTRFFYSKKQWHIPFLPVYTSGSSAHISDPIHIILSLQLLGGIQLTGKSGKMC